MVHHSSIAPSPAIPRTALAASSLPASASPPTKVPDAANPAIEARLAELTPCLQHLAPHLVENIRSLLTLLYAMKEKAPSAMFHVFLEVPAAPTVRTTCSGELQIVFSPRIDAVGG